ncbi:hypothetical protein F8M41_010167 [Gigaspora margarita]|uniref:Uncharacterized protein n=1 Tax=Gigaspora margarita TaxID=4874 RepID=A0A8H4A1H0_GIGMA|nr:hypothetical protein F8M41_010167 [Gigaspora margarita]
MRTICNEKKLPQIIDFWSLESEKLNYEDAIDVEQKRLEFLKARGTVQAYEIGNNYLSRTSSVVENINIKNLSGETTFLATTSTSALTTSDNDNSELEISNQSILGKRIREDKSVEMDEINVDYTKHQLLKAYCTLLSKLQFHPVEEESQRARHMITMLRWHVVDQEMFNSVGWTKIPQKHFVSKPSFSLRLVSNVLKQHSNNQLHLAEQLLQNLIMNNRVENSDHSWMSTAVTSIMQFFSQKLDDKYFDIDALTVVSVVSSIILYKPTPCYGLGSSPSENHIKPELWTKIFSNVFTLDKTKFVPVWELHHLISGNGGEGSAQSDFGAIVNDLQFPFFLVKFERGGFEIHKDNVVVASEAVYEFNRLVNDTRISFSTITPVFNQKESTFVYLNNDKILSYNLITNDMENNIENVLQLVVYLRETICEDGLWIETILNREPTRYNYELKALLPKLPNEAFKSRTSETKFTPLSKRGRCVFSEYT